MKPQNGDEKPFIGVQVTKELFDAIEEWVSLHPETNQSVFARTAFREKLERDSIKIVEN